MLYVLSAVPSPGTSRVVYQCLVSTSDIGTNFTVTLVATPAATGGCIFPSSGTAAVSVLEEVLPTGSYTVDSSNTTYVNACDAAAFPDSTNDAFSATDDATTIITAPVRLTLSDTTSDFVGISTNGVMTTDASFGFATNSCPLLGDDSPRNAVTAFWDVLRVRAANGGVCFATRETPEKLEFVLTWDRAVLYDQEDTTELSFSVIFNNVTRDVVVAYGTFDNVTSADASIGVTDANPSRGTQWSCDEEKTPPGSNTALKFTWVSNELAAEAPRLRKAPGARAPAPNNKLLKAVSDKIAKGTDKTKKDV
jgi:hypothetical protein